MYGANVIRANRHVEPRFLIGDFEPTYLSTYRQGEFPARIDAGNSPPVSMRRSRNWKTAALAPGIAM